MNQNRMQAKFCPRDFFGPCILDQTAPDQLILPSYKLPCFCALARIANAMFLLGDHIVWLHRNNLVQMKDIKEWERFSNKSWLYSIILNLITDYRAIKAASSLPLASASSSSSGGRLNSDPESGNLFQKTVCNSLEKEKLLGSSGISNSSVQNQFHFIIKMVSIQKHEFEKYFIF